MCAWESIYLVTRAWHVRQRRSGLESDLAKFVVHLIVIANLFIPNIPLTLSPIHVHFGVILTQWCDTTIRELSRYSLIIAATLK